MKLSSKTPSAVINAMKNVFSRQGIPETVIADNVPFNSSEFRKFAKEYNFSLITSSLRFPQSNGLAEKYVGIIKDILRRCEETNDDPYLALLRYRNTPVTGMQYSPAQINVAKQESA